MTSFNMPSDTDPQQQKAASPPMLVVRSSLRYAFTRTMKNIAVALSLAALSNIAVAGDAYRNPVDGKTYIADWKTYTPEGGIRNQSARVTNAGIRLLNTQEDFERNTSAPELVKLVGFIHETLAQYAQQYDEGGEILLHITLNQEGKPQFKMSFQGNLRQAFLEQFYKSLSVIEFHTKKETVTLQVHFVVKNS